MTEKRINTTEIQVLKLVIYEPLIISQIATRINRSLSWTSECVTHLTNLGFIDIKKKGISRFVSISSNQVGENLSLLMTQSSYFNLDHILTGSGLLILPLLLPPGCTSIEVSNRISRSLRTVRDKLRTWRSMGIVLRDRVSKMYFLNLRHKYLIQFVISYSESRNKQRLKAIYPEALILWQWRDEFLFSIPTKIEHPEFFTAAASRLVELDYDIVSASHYYFHNPQQTEITEEEALIQTMMITPENPRTIRFLKDRLKQGFVDTDALNSFVQKYGIEEVFDREVKINA